MSKIVLTADTETNEISVKVDGENYDNVQYASLSLYTPYGEDEAELMCCINLGDEEVGGLTKRTMIATANTKEAKALKNDTKAEILMQDSKLIIARMQKSIGEIVAKMLTSGNKK